MAKGEPVKWITVNGKHVPIYDDDGDSHSTTDASKAGKAATNNVVKVCNEMEWGRPMFVDKVAHGYRIHLGDWSETDRNDFTKQIKDKLGIDVTVRQRGGYGRGGWDAIIPFSTEDDKLNYKYKR